MFYLKTVNMRRASAIDGLPREANLGSYLIEIQCVFLLEKEKIVYMEAGYNGLWGSLFKEEWTPFKLAGIFHIQSISTIRISSPYINRSIVPKRLTIALIMKSVETEN